MRILRMHKSVFMLPANQQTVISPQEINYGNKTVQNYVHFQHHIIEIIPDFLQKVTNIAGDV